MGTNQNHQANPQPFSPFAPNNPEHESQTRSSPTDLAQTLPLPTPTQSPNPVPPSGIPFPSFSVFPPHPPHVFPMPPTSVPANMPGMSGVHSTNPNPIPIFGPNPNQPTLFGPAQKPFFPAPPNLSSLPTSPMKGFNPEAHNMPALGSTGFGTAANIPFPSFAQQSSASSINPSSLFPAVGSSAQPSAKRQIVTSHNEFSGTIDSQVGNDATFQGPNLLHQLFETKPSTPSLPRGTIPPTSSTAEDRSSSSPKKGPSGSTENSTEPKLLETSQTRDQESYLRTKLSIKYPQVQLPKGDFEVDLGASPTPLNLTTSPVALYNFDTRTNSTHQITVTNEYIGHTLKEGGRIMKLKSSGRSLFKFHTDHIIGFIISKSKPVRIASVSLDRTLIIVDVTEANETDSSVKAGLIPHLIFERNNGHHFNRVLWHPVNHNIFALTGSENSVFLLDLTLLPPNLTNQRCSETDVKEALKLVARGIELNSIYFSCDGNYLVGSTKKGSIVIWNTELNQFCLEQTIEEQGDVKCALFLGQSAKYDLREVKSKLLVTLSQGQNGVSKVKLWEIENTGLPNMGLQRLQTITLQNSNGKRFDLKLDETSSIISLVEVESTNLYAIHLSEPSPDQQVVTSANFRFDCISKFTLSDTIINLAVTNIHRDQHLDPNRVDGESSDLEMQFTCIHPKGIIQYEVVRWNLRPKEPESVVGVEVKQSEPTSEVKVPAPAASLLPIPTSVPLLVQQPAPIILPTPAFDAAQEKPKSTTSLLTPNQQPEVIPKQPEPSNFKSREDVTAEPISSEGFQVSSQPVRVKLNSKSQEGSQNQLSRSMSGNLSSQPANGSGNYSPSIDGIDQQFKRLETTIVTKSDKIAQQYTDKFYSRIQKDFTENNKSVRSEFEKIEQKITDVVSEQSKLPQAITGDLHQRLSSQISDNISKIAEATFSKMSDQIRNTIIQKLEKQMKDSSKKLIETSSTEIAGQGASQSTQLLRETFLTTYIPQTQQAIQEMGKQINSMFTSYFESMSKMVANEVDTQVELVLAPKLLEFGQAISAENEILYARIKAENQALVEAIVTRMEQQNKKSIAAELEAVHKTMAELRQMVDTLSQGGLVPITSSFAAAGSGEAATNPSLPPKEVVKILIQKKSFVEAFDMALSLQDLELITTLCGETDPFEVCDSLRSRQDILLCLIQQVGFDLTSHTELKLQWLSEALQSVHDEDVFVESNGAMIFSMVLTNIRSLESNPTWSKTLRYIKRLLEAYVRTNPVGAPTSSTAGSE